MKKKKMKTIRPIQKGVFLAGGVLGLTILAAGGYFIYDSIHPEKYIYTQENTLSVSIPYIVDGEAAEKQMEIPRGTRIRLEDQGTQESTFVYEGMEITLENRYLKDSLADCLDIEAIYPRRLLNLRDSKGGALTDTVVKKGEKLKVTRIDEEDLDSKTGEINWYQVEKGNKKYWISGYYIETTKKLATKNWNDDITYSTYWDEYFGEGYSEDAYIDQVDYKPTVTQNYKDNPILENCNAVHVSLENLVKYKDYFLSLSKETDINALVVELKGDIGYLWYESEVVENYLDDPSQAFVNSVASVDELEDLIKEFQDAGYYMIGRIVTFKDQLFALQNPEESITDKEDNLIMHNDEYWPSPYSRKAWMYNVDVAKEIAALGINEIQFDYVRFPDGLSSKMDSIDLKNTYDESKASALQGFLQYAKEELDPYKVYVAADVFAWPMVAEDDQDIGQFFLAMASTVDIISPMPYSDHFSNGAMGIDNPSSEPGKVIEEYSKLAYKELQSLKEPPIYRSWIQGYGNLSPEEIKEQIKGLNESGFEGYMVWFGFGVPDDLDQNKEGYIDSAIQ